MKILRDEHCITRITTQWLVCLLISLGLVSPVTTAEEIGEQALDEKLLEFLGGLDEEPDEWNEFMEMAAEGIPPEYEETGDE
ncbi:MAG: hypothetical protein OEU86_07815 [Gammaproteobacteria bacterium]|nr:hypothetical protein [Gammaproteobacteria bacterium]